MLVLPPAYFWGACFTFLALGVLLGNLLQVVVRRLLNLRRILMVHIDRATRLVELKWVRRPTAGFYEFGKGDDAKSLPLDGEFTYGRTNGGRAFLLDHQLGLPVRLEHDGIFRLIDGQKLHLFRKDIRDKQIKRANGQDYSWLGPVAIFGMVIAAIALISLVYMVGKIYTGMS